jgi:TolB protein
MTTRRDFVRTLAAGSLATLAGLGCRSLGHSRAGGDVPLLLFASAGRTCMIRADGTGFRVFQFEKPDQVTWQPGPVLEGGRQVMFLSMEARRDGPGKPFEEYYTQTPTHLWLYDFATGELTEIATRDRLAVFYTPQLLLKNGRMLVQVVRNKVGQVFNMRLDGSDAHPFTEAGEGLPYGFSLSPDGSRIAFHLASPKGYQIWTSDPEGKARTLVVSHPDHLYFAPMWSPEGEWLAFQDCVFRSDPGHDWSDLCLARGDGSGFRRVTSGQALWFGATYGPADNKGGGSNVPQWTKSGGVLMARRRPGSVVPWQYRVGQPDLDHFNREYLPGSARGGTDIVRWDSKTGTEQFLTRSEPAVWDFRATESPDGRWVAFCRCATGGSPALWVMRSDGSEPRMLSQGIGGAGADHPRWVG